MAGASQNINPYSNRTNTEPDPMTKIKLMGQLIADTYNQSNYIESQHDPNESYHATDRGVRNSLSEGLKKIAFNLDQQADIIKRTGRNVPFTPTAIPESNPVIPNMIPDIQQPNLQTSTIDNSTGHSQLSDDKQMLLDFGETITNEDLNNKLESINSKLEKIMYILGILSEKIKNNTNTEKNKKKVI